MFRDFEEFVKHATARELTPMQHAQHPELELMLAYLAGDLSSYTRSKLTAHLATCPHCQHRWERLLTTLNQELEVLRRLSPAPSLAQPRPDQVRLRSWYKNWWKSKRTTLTFPAPGPALARAGAVMFGMALMLGVTAALVLRANYSTANRLASLTREIEDLKIQLALGQSISADISVPVLTPEEMAQLVAQVSEFPDPWLKALAVTNFLNARGLYLPWEIDWSELIEHRVQPGETWQSLADTYLGTPALWPIIYLLNAERGGPESLPPAGEVIVIPAKK